MNPSECDADRYPTSSGAAVLGGLALTSKIRLITLRACDTARGKTVLRIILKYYATREDALLIGIPAKAWGRTGLEPLSMLEQMCQMMQEAA